MQNLRPSNIKVIFQRPSCGSPIAVASGFIAGTGGVVMLMMSGVVWVCAAEVLDGEGDRSRENHSAEDAEHEEERSHHSGHRLLLSYHVTATLYRRDGHGSIFLHPTQPIHHTPT